MTNEAPPATNEAPPMTNEVSAETERFIPSHILERAVEAGVVEAFAASDLLGAIEEALAEGRAAPIPAGLTVLNTEAGVVLVRPANKPE